MVIRLGCHDRNADALESDDLARMRARRLGEVLPGIAPRSGPERHVADAVFSRQFGEVLASADTLTNLPHVCLCQLGEGVPITEGVMVLPVAAFAATIQLVVLRSAEEQVRRVDATRGVAAVTHVQIIGDRPNEQLVGRPVGCGIQEFAVGEKLAGEPQPTGRRYLNALPELIKPGRTTRLKGEEAFGAAIDTTARRENLERRAASATSASDSVRLERHLSISFTDRGVSRPALLAQWPGFHVPYFTTMTIPNGGVLC